MFISAPILWRVDDGEPGGSAQPDSDNDGDNTGQTSPEEQDFAPIASQEEFERRLSKRLDRERAKFSDYADLKAKADRFDEIEEANRSELDKANDWAAKLEAERDELNAQIARQRVALRHGLSEEDAKHLDSLGDEQAMDSLAERLAKQAEQRDGVGYHLSSPPPRNQSDDAAARAVFGI